MNAEQLLAHYERITEAPDAIKRLRQFILDLAVRGKLVPQDPKDELATKLLERIAEEKARLGIKPALEPLINDEMPFDLPKGWAWTRIGEICSKTGSGSTPRGGKEVYKASGVPFLRSQNVHDDGLRLDDVAYIDSEIHAKMSGTAVSPADLLLNITGGSMGRCCRVPDDFGEANVSQHVAIIRLAVKGLSDFLHKLILAPYFQAFIFDEQTGAGRGGLPKNRMDRIAVAVPPLAEQRRIVAKVDELMAHCDRLEAARATQETTRDRLTAASLGRLNAPDPETFHDDARFALDALPALTTRREQIKQLRQTILNLAARGKLVPQDPKDESASELLKRIAVEHQKRVKGSRRTASFMREGSLMQQTRWVSATLSELTIFENGDRSSNYPSGAEILENGVPFFSTKNLSDFKLGFSNLDFVSPEKFAKLRSGKLQDLDIVVTLRGSVGKFGIFRASDEYKTGFINAQLLIVRSFIPELVEYLLAFMKSDVFSAQVDTRSSGSATPQLSAGQLAQVVVPLPPLAEQRRIVAKVDELMALCDRLEASLTTETETRRKLLKAILAEALQPGEERCKGVRFFETYSMARSGISPGERNRDRT